AQPRTSRPGRCASRLPDRSASPVWSKTLLSAPASTSPQAQRCPCPAASNCSCSWPCRLAPAGSSAHDITPDCAFDPTDTLGGRAEWSTQAKDRGQVAEHGGGSGQGHGE